MKNYNLRYQYMDEIRKHIYDRNYKINHDFTEDIKIGNDLAEEFEELIRNIDFYYEAYENFDYVTFTNKMPHYSMILNEIWMVDTSNPFIEKEAIRYSKAHGQDIGMNGQAEFWQGEGIH